MLEAAKTLLPFVVGFVGLAGFLFGLYQYWTAQKWKKAEFAAKQLQRLWLDEELALCIQLLDWEARTVVFPERFRRIAKEETFHHTWRELEAAMLPEDEKPSFSLQQVVCRDAFDRFFTYLEEINDYLRMGLIEPHHVESLRYWLQQVATPRFPQRPIFQKFIEEYGYSGVTELMSRLEVA